MRNYKESPSAGFELLRFGRVINTEHETLVPAVAPLWMTVSYPGGKGVVNLADPNIKSSVTLIFLTGRAGSWLMTMLTVTVSVTQL